MQLTKSLAKNSWVVHDARVGGVVCVVCGRALRPLFQARGYWVCECDPCGYRGLDYRPSCDHPARVYGDSYFLGGGHGYANYFSEAALLRARGRRYARLMSRFTAS